MRAIEVLLAHGMGALFSFGSGILESTQALDHAIYGKVLPKLRGEDTERLRVALVSTGKVLKDHGLKDSAEKVAELAKDLAETGSARFWR